MCGVVEAGWVLLGFGRLGSEPFGLLILEFVGAAFEIERGLVCLEGIKLQFLFCCHCW